MRVVHLSTDDVTGGAARCAARLHEGLLQVGVHSTMMVDRKRGSGDGVVAFRRPEGLWGRSRLKKRKRRVRSAVDQYRESRPEGYEPFNPDESPYGATPFEQLPDCDVLNLHWVARFVDVAGLTAWLPPEVPVVWTLHDMHLLTGGCHYNDGCRRFESGCGECPQLGSTDLEDLSSRTWTSKRDALATMAPGSVEVVTPSRWLASEARKSGVIPGGFGVRVIPYGLDTKLFAPVDRAHWRRHFDVPDNARVVLFVAQSVENRRKGFALLAEALGRLKDVDDLVLVSVGKGEPEVDGAIPLVHLGEIRSDEDMAGIYGLADVFCVPSIQDNLPATVLESLSCGTPVAGFAAGGIPDMVRPAETGELAEAKSGTALADAIRRILESGDPGLRDRCRATAVREYALDLQASRYQALYEELLAGRVSTPLTSVSVS